MFCSRCGKRVLDSMLFCPFCGAEIIIPDQDVNPAAEEVPVVVESEPSTTPEIETAEICVDEEIPIPVDPEADWPEPSDTDEDWHDLPKAAEQLPSMFDSGTDWADPPKSIEEPTADEAEPQKPTEDAPKPIEDVPEPPKQDERPDRSQRRRAAVAPQRMITDLFLEDDDDDDDFDAFEEAFERGEKSKHRRSRHSDDLDDDDEDYDEDYDDDEGFFTRHLRGIVGLLLFLALLAGLTFYALSDPGQAQMARLNMTLPIVRAEAYSRLGYDAYQIGSYADAGLYYERALAREPGNYNYASSAAMAYVSGNDVDRAARMLKKCIEINPDAVEPYIYLLNLYPNPNTRPWEVSRLVEQGYQRTGDARLEAE